MTLFIIYSCFQFCVLQGLQDDIHTVVIQALNTFDKIFPCVINKYMSEPSTSLCQKDQRKKQQADDNKSKNKQEQKQDNSSKVEKSYENASGITQTDKTGTDTAAAAAAATTRTNFKCVSGHFNDNDVIIDALLNAFQLQTKFNNDLCKKAGVPKNTNTTNEGHDFVSGRAVNDATNPTKFLVSSSEQPKFHTHNTILTTTTTTSIPSCLASHDAPCCGNKPSSLFLSPKLLLNKLRLCHYNKYWLVQNKYAEVISNLNYASLRSYYGNNYTNNTNSKNHNKCTTTSHCNCNCCRCPSLGPTASYNATSSSCHSCCCCCGNSLNGHVDDGDNADFVCNLEVSIVTFFVCIPLSFSDLSKQFSLHTYIYKWLLKCLAFLNLMCR